MIYLDNNATTQVDPAVRDAILPCFGPLFGNPSSLHSAGIEARKAVEEARGKVAALIGSHADEIIFTSGGSESNNLAIKGVAHSLRTRGNHIITTAIEHPAVSEVCNYLEKEGFRISRVRVDSFGMVDPEEIRNAITPSTILISVMHANNETGTIQPVEEIGRIAREHRILFHSDAAQSVGKIPVSVDEMRVDLLSLAGHKFYAPKGIGVLYIRRGVKPEKLIHGADHEQNMRAGTENVPYIVGIGKAAELIADNELRITNSGLRDRLEKGILERFPEVRLNGHPEKRLPNTASLGFPGAEANILLNAMKGIESSAGAACHAGSSMLSGVLGAMQVPMEYAMGTIRFSTGRFNTPEEIDRALEIISEAYSSIRPAPEGRSPVQHSFPGPGVRLTEYTRSLGCACKINPRQLEEILRGIPFPGDPMLLVGTETSDDAAVYRIDSEKAIVQTVDFIPPVVDDPYTYGAVAAANALSDIYAMGGKPLFALNIVAFPEGKLPLQILKEILKGASDKAAEAGVTIAGGHSIDDPEPKFGLVVTGVINPEKILRNSGAQPGDALILTKPIGSGIITTALKRGLASTESIKAVIRVMTGLNKKAAEIMSAFTLHGCTDVTGFGLLGHLKEMVRGAGTGIILFAEKVPVISQAWEYAAAGMVPGGTLNNLDYIRDMVEWETGIAEIEKSVLADAQTSGGLLICLPEKEAGHAIKSLHEAGIKDAAWIGTFTGENARIIVRKK